jgi:hypothetical protein
MNDKEQQKPDNKRAWSTREATGLAIELSKEPHRAITWKDIQAQLGGTTTWTREGR